MDRRTAVKNMAFLMGGALSATTLSVFLEGCGPSPDSTGVNLFTEAHEKLLVEIADTIIPATGTPGAREANVGPFISMMVKECYPEDAQQAFAKGLNDLEQQANEVYKKSFTELGSSDRNSLLNKVREATIADIKAENENLDKQKQSDQEKQRTNPEKGKSQTENAGIISILPKDKPKTEPRFFAIVRDLTLLGFFTSEIGATQAYEYVEIPGRYDGCTDLKPGQRVWA